MLCAPSHPASQSAWTVSSRPSARRSVASHAVGPDRERYGLRAALDRDAQALKPFFEQPLGVRLRQHQRVRIRARHRIHFDVTDDGAVRRHDIDAIDLESRLDERRGPLIPAVEKFERAAPQHEGFRFVRALRGLVDDPNRNSVAGEFARERQPHRARADDQYGRVHWRSPDLRVGVIVLANFSTARSRWRQLTARVKLTAFASRRRSRCRVNTPERSRGQARARPVQKEKRRRPHRREARRVALGNPPARERRARRA